MFVIFIITEYLVSYRDRKYLSHLTKSIEQINYYSVFSRSQQQHMTALFVGVNERPDASNFLV